MFEFLTGPWAADRPDCGTSHRTIGPIVGTQPNRETTVLLNRGKNPRCFFAAVLTHTFLRVNYIIGINFDFFFNLKLSHNYDVITMSHTKQNVNGTFSIA